LIDKGVSQRTIAVQFDFAMLATENINKNRVVIPKAREENCSNERKRKLRETDSEAVNIPIFSQMYSGHCCYRAITSNKNQGNCTGASY